MQDRGSEMATRTKNIHNNGHNIMSTESLCNTITPQLTVTKSPRDREVPKIRDEKVCLITIWRKL